MRAYIDSDVLIWHLRGKQAARTFLQKLRDDAEYELWIGALQRAEILFFMRPEEKKPTELLLSLFRTASVDQETIDVASSFYRKWNPSHGIGPNDAILAAIVARTGGKIFCLNKKHYPMPDVLVERPW